MTRRRIVMALALLMVAVGAVVLRRVDPGPVVRTVALDGHRVNVVVDGRHGRAFVATITNEAGASGDVIVLDTRTGSRLATITEPMSWWPPVVMALDQRAQRLFVFGFSENTPERNTLKVLHARSGQVLRAAVLPGLMPVTAAVDERDGRVFLLTIDGRIGDDGKHWMSTALLDIHSPWTCMNLVDFVGTQDGWAFLGARSRLYATKDGARHGRVIASHLQLGSLRFVTRRIGFALAGPFHQG